MRVLSLDSFQEAANKIGWVWNLLRVPVVLALPIWWIYCQSKAEPEKKEREPGSGASALAKNERRKDDLTRTGSGGDRAESGESPE
jgi:hypothetical protein